MKLWIFEVNLAKYFDLNLFSGTLTVFLYGKVISGFWKGSTITTVARFINEEPEACFTKTGVTRSYSSFASLTFQKNCKERLVCFSNTRVEYYPGLKTSKPLADQWLLFYNLNLDSKQIFFQVINSWIWVIS